MTEIDHQKDLVILAADKNMEAALSGILSRHHSLGIRQISYDIFVHVHNDPGCLNTSDQFLRSFVNRYRYAIVIFDLEGCGRVEHRAVLENLVESSLHLVGWQDRCATIVLDPELEIWVWTKSPYVDKTLGWMKQTKGLRDWLTEQNYMVQGDDKPQRPKEAMEAALKFARIPRSSSVYYELACKVSLDGHQEPAFLRLRTTLQKWFSQ